ncbi:MAG: FG-GAP-like repeat-containing protein [Gemmataceae bacterium]
MRVTPASTTFAAIGDYGIGGGGEAQVAALVKSWNPDSIITVGDNNYEVGSAATIDANVGQFYHEYIGNYVGGYGPGSPTNRFFPSLGTHDWDTRVGNPPLPTPYLDYFTLPGNERYYTFTRGPVQFFALDSGDGTRTNTDGFEPDGFSSTSVQGQWLHDQLAASTAPWKIVYFHHAPYSSSFFHSSTIMQWPFQAWGASAVISGHDHDYERFNIDGMPYFVNGVGGESFVAFKGPLEPGSQVRYADNWGAMKINADDTNLDLQFISLSGTVIDDYAMVLPTVSVTATDAIASEPGANTGLFTITRTGNTAAPMTVNLSIGGSANNSADYRGIPSTITIPAGSSSVVIPVNPSDDALIEGNESVTLTVAASTQYQIGTSSTGTVTILDNDVAGTSGPGGTISGVTFVDNNRNGVKDAGESPSKSETVFLDTNLNGQLDAGEPVATIAADGSFSFSVPTDNVYSVQVIPPAGFGVEGPARSSVIVSSGNKVTSASLILVPPTIHLAAIGQISGGQVLVTNANGTFLSNFTPFPGFAGGIHVAIGDVNGDGQDDVIVGAGFGGGPHVRIYDGTGFVTGATPQIIREFFAYSAAFHGGVNVASADVDGDGKAEVITGAGPTGGPHVRVFSGATGAVLGEFFAYSAGFLGGVNVAAGVLTSGGPVELVTGAGAGGGPHVRVFAPLTGIERFGFFAFDASYHGGVSVAVGDLDGGLAAGDSEIVAGTARGSVEVRVFAGADGQLVHTMPAYAFFSGGVSVAIANFHDVNSNVLLVGAGPGGGPHVRFFDGSTFDERTGFYAFDPGYTGGIYVG